MRKPKIYLIFVFFSLSFIVYSQKTFPNNGPADEREDLFAFTNATIFSNYNTKIENATLLVRKGIVEGVGKNVNIPKGAVVQDLKGKFIYPAFIDIYSDYGLPIKSEDQIRSRGRQAQILVTKREGPYAWNDALKTDFNASENFEKEDEKAKILRDLGFSTVLTHHPDGISRGFGLLVNLENEKSNETILKDKTAHFLSFNKGSSAMNYPSSLMGVIALIRQTNYDAQWYKNGGHKEETNLSLEAWNEAQNYPQIFEVSNKLEVLSAANIAKEFAQKYIIKDDSGDEYQRLEAIKALGVPLIVTLNFPSAYDVEDPYDAQLMDLARLKHWELAPTNPAKISNAGIEMVLTSFDLKNKNEFFPNLKKAIEYGLSESDALKALTYTPAKLINMSNVLGDLQTGKMANFIITSSNIFDKDAKIYENWIKGKPYIVNEMPNETLTQGVYNLNIGDKTYKLLLQGKGDKPEMYWFKETDSLKVKVDYQLGNGTIRFNFTPTKDSTFLMRLSGLMDANAWAGNANLSDGTWSKWSATYLNAAPLKKISNIDKKETITKDLGDMIYPFVAHGWKVMPQQKTYLIKNATVWTNEKEGILNNTDVLIQNGKIQKIGRNLSANQTEVVDGTGKHLTAGIIDEHSHIAISRGVNEGTQESSAEVRISDVIDSEDTDIYFQLAGGVTSSHLLHGSANPIGGQTQLIKLRWGAEPEKLKFEGWDGFIKFALGENVKQSNWDIPLGQRIRFPQTRMGVEQVFDDYFTRAKEYDKLKISGKLYRKDLDLEAISEILNKKRFITCHSYVQSEINMLLKVADRQGFKVNTFTHILEGYKVADKMAKHGAAGSTFSDWWAYKYEVYNAIPYNGALMRSQGVLTAFNSDDAEMARRLNQEAGKAIKYGDVPEEEALKFVTLNPAKMLHIDNRVGSIKVGKDADIVLWSAHPLSVYAKAEKTFVDGIKYFDREEDLIRQAEINQERSRLIQKMINAKKGGQVTQAAVMKPKKHYHCDSEEE